MTSERPLPPPASPRGRSGVRVGLAVITGLLTLAAVVGMGWFASSGRSASSSATDTPPYVVPDAAWSTGAEQAWTVDVPEGAEVLTAGGYLLTVERDPHGQGPTHLTAYEVDTSGATPTWSTSVELPESDVAAPGPPYQLWGESTLVHGGTLIDLTTGTVSQAPWPADAPVLIAGNRALTCPDETVCHGWAPGVSTAVWTAPVPAGAASLSSQEDPGTVHHRSSQRYTVLGQHTVVNIDTGETVPLTLPPLRAQTVIAAADGWVVVSWVLTDGTHHVHEFGPDGGDPVTTYEAPSPVEEDELLLTGQQPPTRAELRALWADGDTSLVLGRARTGDDGPADGTCVRTVALTGGPEVQVPTVVTGGAPDVIGQGEASCAIGVLRSEGGDVVVVRPSTRLTASAFTFMYDGSTGEQVVFPGADPADGDGFSVVSGGLVVGHDVDAGLVHGYVPAR